MVSTATIVCILISMLMSLVLPAALLIFFAVKHKKQGIIPAWLLGAAGFFVTQILIRVPILTVLQTRSWFLDFSRNHVFGYAFSLAFTAGLFELAGRFAVAKLLNRKELTRNRALAAGLGHGGIEAMVITGIAMVNNLIYVVMINTGAFDTLVAQTAAGMDAAQAEMITAQLEMIRTQLIAYAPALFLLGGFERILAMIAHLGMSVLVCYGVAFKKVLPCTLMCLLIHTFIDLTAGLSLVLPQATAYPIIYAILIAVAVFSLVILRELSRRWKETEVPHDSEE